MEMSAALGREIFLIELWHFLALAVILIVNAWFYRNAEKNGLLYRYLSLQIALGIWIISKMLKTVAPNSDLRWFFIVSQYFGICMLGPLLLLFAWRYVYGKEAHRIIKILLYVPALGLFLVVASNPLHYLFYATYTFYRDTFGPLYYAVSGYSYILVLLSTGLFLYGLRKQHKENIAGDIFIALAAVLPLLINIAYSYRLIRPLFDYTPLYMTLSLVFFGIAAFRSRFLGILPAAWKTLLLELEDPLLLIDDNGRIIQTNKLPFGIEVKEEIHFKEQTYRLHRKSMLPGSTIYHYVDTSSIDAIKKELTNKNTELEETIAALQLQNRKTLNMMKASLFNKYSRQLHDILGHSLTQIIYLLRLEKEKPGNNSQKKERYIVIDSILSRGIQQLENSLDESIAEGNSLSIALRNLIEASCFPDIKIDFFLRGNEIPLDEEVVQELCSCCREAITNAVKHGKAKKIDVLVLYGKKQVALLIVDNGQGCAHIHQGNGLSLMQNAIAAHHGTIAFSSESGGGFQLTARIPYQNEAVHQA